MTPRKPKHGGKRKGAGRPAPAGVKIKRVTLNMLPKTHARLVALRERGSSASEIFEAGLAMMESQLEWGNRK